MERFANILKVIIQCILLVVFAVLIITGQKSIGYMGVALMIIGLAGILGLLYFYNKSQS